MTPQQLRTLANRPDVNHWSAAAREALEAAADSIEQWIRVAAKLGDRIDAGPHDRLCGSFSWNSNGTGWDHNPENCNCWKADVL